MSIAQMPFTKIVEDVMSEVRENSTETSVENKYKRRVNDIYVRDLPSKQEFDFLRKEGSFSLIANYHTGTVTTSVNSTMVTGLGTTWTSAMTGRLIKISGNDEIYTFTVTNSTTGNLNTTFTGNESLDGAAHNIYQDTYNLASDYDRVIDPPGFYYDYSMAKVTINQKLHKDWYKQYTTAECQLPDGWHIPGQLDSTNQYWRIQVGPPVSTARVIKYDYIPLFSELSEYTTGTASSTAGITTIHGISTDFVNNVIVGDAFRFDSRVNDWYIISATTSSTSITLSSSYPTTISSGTYTISKIPKLPVKLQMALFYGACMLSSQDQDNDRARAIFDKSYKETIGEYIALTNRIKMGKQRMKVKDMYRGR
mgnify:CR=1 FL=1